MAARAKFPRLMEPGYLGSVRTKNRILKTGSSPGFYPWEGGHIQQKAIDYYEALAKGGSGLVTVGAAPLGVPPGIGYLMDDDKFLPGMIKLAQAIHACDCPAFVQMFHLGPMVPVFLSRMGHQSVAASSLSKDELPIPTFAVAKELSIEEINGIVHDFVDQADRIKRAGFDGIELNAACNHLLNSFLSRAWNKRNDEYGEGSMEDRARIVVDIIKEIKARNGNDFCIVALINGAEPGLDKGITIGEAKEIARILEAAGADALHVRAEFYNRPEDPVMRDSTQFPDIALYPEVPFPVGPCIDTSRHGAGGWVPLAAEVKKAVSIPVIAIGRLDLETGEKLLRRRAVDFISFNRRLLADHELPNKVAQGRLDDITPCTGCLTCFDNNENANPPLCQVNASNGKEKEYEIRPAEHKKRVLVIGGGPAGMETARIAAQRGHEVILYEKHNKLGGSLPVAAMVKGFDREDILSLIHYLSVQVAKMGVDIRLGQAADRKTVEEIKPDVVIIATGGIHDIPEIPGIDGPDVVTGEALHRRVKGFLKFFNARTLRWLSRFWLPIGKRVVIIGGNIQGCQTAEFLVKRGRSVTIVDTADEIGEGLLHVFVKPHLLMWMKSKGVTIIPSVKYERITARGLVIKTKDGEEKTIECDTIVTALPLLPDSNLREQLKDSAREVYSIGDCNEPRLIVNAIADGSRVAREI